MSSHSANMLTAFRWTATVLVLTLGAGALVFSNAVRVTDEALDRVMRYDVAWSGSQGRHEAARLEREAIRFAAAGDETAEVDEVELAFDILRNRISIWSVGDFGSFLDRNQRASDRFSEIADHVDALGEWLEQPSSRDVDELLSHASAIRQLIDRLGMLAHTTGVAEVAEIREDLRDKQSVQRILIISLFGVGLFLIGVTMLQNRSLRIANQATRETAAQFEHLAHHDPLTGLPNRTGFNICFESARGRATAGQEQIAILALDLDGFKAINDALGHATGDSLLQSVGERLQARVHAWDPRSIVSRFGGDEFVIILFLSPDQDPVEQARELRQLLRKPHDVEGSSVLVDATIGLAVSTPNEKDNADLLRDADLALTKAKAAGKGSVSRFHSEIREGVTRQLKLERDLEVALREGQILPHYQPQVDFKTGRVAGVEALARWHHPKRGWISPCEFIPVAEASGQIVELGRTILETACEQALSLPGRIPVSVNMSVAQLLRDDAVDEVVEIVRSSGLPPERLKIEVTESVVMSDAERGLAALEKLKNAGIKIALDDFGTGYSALSYLRQFPWDQLKIDRSFVAAMRSDERSMAIVRSMVALAKQIGIQVVAEGVEEPYQRLLLMRQKCDIGQGYLFSRPLPLDELALFILKESPKHATPSSKQRKRL